VEVKRGRLEQWNDMSELLAGAVKMLFSRAQSL
jgi:hypothetical protein